MGLKLNRGGRVAAATVLATLLLSLAFVSAFKLGSRAQPAYAPCSRSCAACASASPGGAPKAVNVEWLNGSERASAVERALSLEEFGKVASALERLGYKLVSDKAVAARFVRDVNGRLIEYLLVGIPFEGDPEKPIVTLVTLKPIRGAVALQIDTKSNMVKLIAREPSNIMGVLLSYTGKTQTLTASSCPSCYYTYTECTQWDYACITACCIGCVSSCLGGWASCLVCVFAVCPTCALLCCTQTRTTCIYCDPPYGYPCSMYEECMENCPECGMGGG